MESEIVNNKSASSSTERGLAKRVCKQLAEDIERSGGIHRFDKGVKQGLNVLLEAGDSECYGKRGSKVQRKITQNVSHWKTLSPAKYASVLFKLGVTPANAQPKGEIEKLVKYPKKGRPRLLFSIKTKTKTQHLIFHLRGPQASSFKSRFVLAVLHFFNQMPIKWFSKKQATVETTTYGSEFVAAKLAIQKIISLHIYLPQLGVTIKGSSHLFGDNGSVVTGGSVPHLPLKKQHHTLSYHYTQEAVASKAVDFQFILGCLNPADILSKHWGYQQVWTSALCPMLFWTGDTTTLIEGYEQPQSQNQRKSLQRLHSPLRLPRHLQFLPKGSDKYSIRTRRHSVKMREP
jgi:hypothetical protein